MNSYVKILVSDNDTPNSVKKPLETKGVKFIFGNNSSNSNNDPNPVFIIKNLEDQDAISKDINLLRGKSGIYCFINNTNDKRYIGSAKDLYLRFQEHIKGKKSNSSLQLAFNKYGLDSFSFCVYE